MSGGIRLGLGEAERQLLKSLPQQLIDMLEGDPDEPALRRLFPRAYQSAEDLELEAEYQRLMGSELRDQHRSALEVILATVDNESLDEEQANAWVIGLNELRLVLGTVLDITEDEEELVVEPDDPRIPQFALYDYLTGLQGALVDQLLR